MVNNRRSQFTPVQRAILTTILYSDIFSFPLTKDELWRFLISDTKIPRKEFEANLRTIHSIVFQDGYYCFKSHERSILQRKRRFPEVSKKLEIAKHVSKKLSILPSILFIGISGGLAAGNVEAEDDIDFVVITKKNTLFTSRFLILIILELLGMRRARNQKRTADTVCLNLLFDETEIDWFKIDQNVYTAREIAQILPLFERNDMYHSFFKANEWIIHFLPNITENWRSPSSFFRTSSEKDKREGFFENFFFNPFIESVLRFSQMRWMKRYQTKEVIKKNILAFHPNDYRTLTLKKLRLKMRQFGLLTKF